ncbi:hypothetical protein NDN08_003454 [Rhodosorus marinus]|uniref:Formamidopyrimidine-DNA glycosylase catalytic domain-containing protein n=1 Tax=Rhodosorus marinus TaxID=101924 RepID=A0AAV8V2H3_9RHOD|nr:hypothetical protein NDN08_003454 [Rhodosorus marinus]
MMFVAAPSFGSRRCRSNNKRMLVLRFPEGPEVKVMAEHLRTIEGMALSNVLILSGRYSQGAEPKGLDQFRHRIPMTVLQVNCKGKLLYMRCQDGSGIYFTLGMTGTFSFEPSSHSRLLIEMSGTGRRDLNVFFNDQRNFGTVTFCKDESEMASKLKKIGESYLDGLTEDRFVQEIQKQTTRKPKRSLAVFLMDQSKTSGVGNYVLSESLYRARISPWATVDELSSTQCSELFHHIRNVIYTSYEKQTGAGFQPGSHNPILQVYGRSFDAQGRKVVRDEGPHGRSVWFVPEVQGSNEQ